MQITAQLVKELREKTGAGMLKCKEALVECNGDFETAVDYLRKKGLASADKRSGRATSQGLVIPLATADKRTAAIVEVNCETDFVARNEDFAAFANKIADLVLKTPSVKTVEDLNKLTVDGHPFEEFIKSKIATTGENISVSRAEHLAFPAGQNGIFATYVHGEGSIGVLIQVKTETEAAAKNPEVASYAHEVALQVAAMNPIALSSDNITQEVKTRELNIAIEKTKAELIGKAVNKALEKEKINPAHVDSEDHMKSNMEKGWIDQATVDKAREIIKTASAAAAASLNDKMIHSIAEGRLNKYFMESCLLDQAYVKDDKKSISDLTNEASKAIGAKIELVGYRRWARGEAEAGEATPEEKASEAAG
ncbi:MAG: Translation elongation factor Ts [Candidatus Rifleibacterium amylolyticum]|nr:MAG: Translation elongation factor Ts [Candidatus Rifleibacterium amylolyticum]NLF97967.1 elongation factor Ts [Candidatus Riflebacteria bacterium]